MKRLDISPLPPNVGKYINLVADVELERAFDESVRQLNEIDKNLLEKLDGKRCAPNKWTVKDILQHLADPDRIIPGCFYDAVAQPTLFNLTQGINRTCLK